jgi:protein SCO1/2
MSRGYGLLLAVFILLLAIGGAFFGTLLITNKPAEVIATSSSAVGGPFTLMATDGKTVTDQTYRGKWLLIYFGYTFCPDACPTALTNIGVSLEKLGPEAANLEPLFITVDPKRDTREAMADYMKSFDSRIVGLTGTEQQIASVAQAYRVYYAPQKTGGDDYLVDHSTGIYLMNPAGKFMRVFASDLSGDEMAEKLRKVMNQTA